MKLKKHIEKMTLQYHPDKQKGKTEEEIEHAKQLFHKVTQAHDVLKDEKLRAQFDEDLEFGLGDEESYYGGGGAYSIYSNKNEWKGGEKENEIVDMDFLVEWIVLRHIYIHYFLYMVCTMQ